MVEALGSLNLHHLLLLLLILPLLCMLCADGVQRLGDERVLALQRPLQWGESISTSSVCQPQRSRKEKGATILEMRHHSYCSQPLKISGDRLQEILILDKARIAFLQHRVKGFTMGGTEQESLATQIPLTSGAKLQTLNYIVTIELGGRKTTVIVDTGSDLTWVQCKPCLYCYNQQDPLFDPSASHSYQTIPCNSPTCSNLQLATGSSGVCGVSSSCNYALSYGDGSYTRGVLAQEHISLGGTTVSNFIFGCGQSNHGLFGGASGLMGLGRTHLSLVYQTLAQFGGVFSYCLPTKMYNSSGSLVLGNDTSVYMNTTPIVYTRMISDPEQEPFYYLNLTGMSVGGVGLQADGFSNGKILIDSGTVITRLVPSVYRAVKTEFMKQFSGFPPAPGFSILDTCFNLTGYEEVKIPILKFEFEGGVKVNVDVTGIFYIAKKDASQVCLALASLTYEDEVGIIGNYQQKNLRVVYDTAGSKLGFAEEACGYS